jgi:hypothetical protein
MTHLLTRNTKRHGYQSGWGAVESFGFWQAAAQESSCNCIWSITRKYFRKWRSLDCFSMRFPRLVSPSGCMNSNCCRSNNGSVLLKRWSLTLWKERTFTPSKTTAFSECVHTCRTYIVPRTRPRRAVAESSKCQRNMAAQPQFRRATGSTFRSVARFVFGAKKKSLQMIQRLSVKSTGR